MSSSNIDLMPRMSDLLSAGTAAAVCMIFKQGSPMQQATEQFVAQIAGRVTSNYFTLTDNLRSEQGTLSEHDFHVALLRGGYSLSQKRKNERVAMDAGRGLIYSVAGRQIDQQFVNKTA